MRCIAIVATVICALLPSHLNAAVSTLTPRLGLWSIEQRDFVTGNVVNTANFCLTGTSTAGNAWTSLSTTPAFIGVFKVNNGQILVQMKRNDGAVSFYYGVLSSDTVVTFYNTSFTPSDQANTQFYTVSSGAWKSAAGTNCNNS